MVIKQYSVYWVNLDPTVGNEVSKTRPCLVVSPDEMNRHLKTVIIAPLTHTLKIYPSRVLCEIIGDKGAIMLDQIRTVDQTRMGSLLGQLSAKETAEIRLVINKMLC